MKKISKEEVNHINNKIDELSKLNPNQIVRANISNSFVVEQRAEDVINALKLYVNLLG